MKIISKPEVLLLKNTKSDKIFNHNKFPGMKKLEAINIFKRFQSRVVVNNLSLFFQSGEITGLLGPNGAGKTTTFNLIVGLIKPDAGNIFYNNLDITAFPVFKRARSGISFLPQEISIFKNLTVRENLLAVSQFHNLSDKIIQENLALLGLEKQQNLKAGLLSGGERRRLEIARCLLFKPDFLLLDEPFAGIDPIQIDDLKTILLDLKNREIGIIITDHNVREIFEIANRAYIISQGMLIFSGECSQLVNNQRVINEFLGKEFRWN